MSRRLPPGLQSVSSPGCVGAMAEGVGESAKGWRKWSLQEELFASLRCTGTRQPA